MERGEILEDLNINLETQTISIPLKTWMVPNVYVSLWIEGKDQDNNPHVKWGVVNIPITDPDRKLDIFLTPEKENYRPGEEAVIKFSTTANGHSVPAEITVMVVDETLRAIKSQESIDIYNTFLADLPLGVQTTHSLANFISNESMTLPVMLFILAKGERSVSSILLLNISNAA